MATQKKYQVFQDGIPCSQYKMKGFENDTFDNILDAVIFMYMWAYPIDVETAKACAMKFKACDIGKDIDMSMCEYPVYMKVQCV
jgi:hypothetical protein